MLTMVDPAFADNGRTRGTAGQKSGSVNLPNPCPGLLLPEQLDLQPAECPRPQGHDRRKDPL